MPKRFTATEKWIDPWFCALPLADKLFWVYLLDNCDHAGIWQVNWPLVRFHIPGYEFGEVRFEGRVTILGPEKWFIPKFVQFQYGELNPANRAHASVVSILMKEGAYKGLTRSLIAHKDKDKDSVEVKEGGAGGNKARPKDAAEVTAYAKSIGFSLDGQYFIDHYAARGWQYKNGQPMKDWQAAVRTWRKNNFEGGKNGADDKPSPISYAALARAKRESEGLRKATSAGEILGRFGNLSNVQTPSANSLGERNDDT